MPLSTPIEREHLHTRKITCEGYKRSDGLWDIEAHLTDQRDYDCSYDKVHRGGKIAAGELVHDMFLRVTIDLDFFIHNAEACSDQTPFAVCTLAPEEMEKLKGIQIGAGWMKTVRSRIGSRTSCTHLMDLLGPISNTAYQTLHAALEEREKTLPKRGKPHILDTCVALATDREIVRRRWPEFYTGIDRPPNS